MFPRDVLNRLRWEEGRSLDDADIVITHRGAPDDQLRIQGKDVVSIGHMFIYTADASIPFHRVLEIWYRGEKIFDKRGFENQNRKNE